MTSPLIARAAWMPPTSDPGDVLTMKALTGGSAPQHARALLVINPHSRRGAMAAEAAHHALSAVGASVARESCADRDDLAGIIRRWQPMVDRVILGGGDGTLNAAAPALVETGLPFGILPLGTANDLARTLGIPNDLGQAAAIAAAGQVRRIDLGCVNGHFFFNVASLGLSVTLTAKLTRAAKRRWGKLAYLIVAAHTLLEARPFRAIIRHCGQIHRVKTLQITVGNGRFYGGGLAVEKDARIDDQTLDFYSLEPRELWRLVLMLRSFRTGHHGALDEVRAHRCTEVEIRTRRPRAINTDGEITTATPARFRIIPQAVSVFAPPPADGSPATPTAIERARG